MSDKHYDISYLEGTASILKKLKEYSYNPFTAILKGTVLELGCGTGIDAINLGNLLGKEVKIVGIDHDSRMIDKAISAAADNENVEFILSEASPIPFEDATLSGIRTERLIQHLKEPQKVINEAYRVLKPGQPLVIVETDWSNLSFYNADTAIEGKVSRYLTDEKINNGRAARQLTGYLEKAEFKNIKLEVFPFVLKSLKEVFTYLLIDQSLTEMKSKGYLNAEEYDSFIASLQRADSNHYFACSMNLVVASALK
ncbi:methyltransferase domain-containing protein [Arcticibacter tournemirensis]|uniref:Methyltransferase domain-containing protein n=1 Tax=Arcticibacter tournemirensis TaxID=699437 RepID=A0A4Q0ME57_9SPHI|nr:methyltransferase domain-containing protein [Arcticibacter tournemirensis]RXF71707.1 methyltransferase domain-containing protein [Arcticibacter tournemirensis]